MSRRFTVSQVRVAATCPRIFYFDQQESRRQAAGPPKVTRIWRRGKGDTTALGSLFHRTIEAFNDAALGDRQVHTLLANASDVGTLQQGLQRHIFSAYLDTAPLYRATAEQQSAFVEALRRYLNELATLVHYGRGQGMSEQMLLDHLFGETRRRMDVTYPLADGESVQIVGILDYVFYDWRKARHRIIDYKLTPAGEPQSDLFQVCIYALMHHAQHGTQADAAVLYLHPQRSMVERDWEGLYADRAIIERLLASMVAWCDYDAERGQGLKPPGDSAYCDWCPWREQCEARLGDRREGGRAGDPPAAPPPLTPLAQTTPEPPTGLAIGHTADGQPLQLPPHILPTHTAVVGAAGSGKTWLAKVIAEEAILNGVPVLAIDPQGDLVQFLRRAAPERLAGLTPAERQRYERYWERVEPRIFTPGSSHATRLSLNPLRLPDETELAGIDNPARREEERDALFAAAATNLVGLAQAGGEQQVQENFLLQLLKLLRHHADSSDLDLHTLLRFIHDPEQAGMMEPELIIKKSEREKLARKLNAVLFGAGATLFRGGQPLDLTALRRPTTAGRVPLNVIYLNALTHDDQKQFFVAALATEIYRWMVSSAAGGGTQLLFYLDEARDYIPAGASKPPAKQPLIRLFTQGRKFGVAGLLCTQSPRSVDYNVFGNCSTKIIGRVESSQDAERVAEWFTLGGAVPRWVSARQGAQAGSFVGRWPGMPTELEGVSLQSRPLFSLHEGAWPPERVEQEMAGQRATGQTD